MARVNTFDDWVDYFHLWQQEIGIDPLLLGDYQFGVKYDDPPSNEIEFGSYQGDRRWESVMEIPDQRIRDALLHLIVYQGDTEFASTEQQRLLLNNPPSHYDLQCAARVMREEMRHGWQMSHLLIKHFGRSGKLEAQKLLERRAYLGTRLLGAFNQDVHDWLDFYCYTALVDRDGKYQLTMLSRSSFKPLASSMDRCFKKKPFISCPVTPDSAGSLKPAKCPYQSSRSTSTSGIPLLWIFLAWITRIQRTGFTYGV
jgi:benzoyl-CoA 2,3-dioxygenase component B